jgi:hypothetical protein
MILWRGKGKCKCEIEIQRPNFNVPATKIRKKRDENKVLLQHDNGLFEALCGDQVRGFVLDVLGPDEASGPCRSSTATCLGGENEYRSFMETLRQEMYRTLRSKSKTPDVSTVAIEPKAENPEQ